MTRERTLSRARRSPAPKPYPLRYSSAPGIRAWTALPGRDQALLRWLLLGSVVTSDLAALLVYDSVRTARRRLSRLVAEGLLRGYWTANNQRPRGRYAYGLLGPVRDALVARLGQPGSRRGAPAATGTIHQLATHDLLAGFLRADPPAGSGLAKWLPERPLANLFEEYLRPDALAIVAVPDGRVTMFIERDLGTEPTRVLVAKVVRYRTLLARAGPVTTNLGIVVESRRRAESLLTRLGPSIGDSPRVWLGVAADLVADPFVATWRDAGGDRRSTIELPRDPGPPDRVLGRLCLVEPDGLEAFEPDANHVPVLKPFIRHLRP